MEAFIMEANIRGEEEFLLNWPKRILLKAGQGDQTLKVEFWLSWLSIILAKTGQCGDEHGVQKPRCIWAESPDLLNQVRSERLSVFCFNCLAQSNPYAKVAYLERHLLIPFITFVEVSLADGRHKKRPMPELCNRHILNNFHSHRDIWLSLLPELLNYTDKNSP